MPNDVYFDAPAARPEPATRRPLHEPLLDVVAVGPFAEFTPEQRLTADRVAVWWASLPLWRQLAWSEALLAAPPRPVGGVVMSMVRGGPAIGRPVFFRDWHAVAFSFDRVGIHHETYRAIRDAVTRVVAAREASGLGPEHPRVRRHESGTIYLWGDDWRGFGTRGSRRPNLFDEVLAFMTRVERRADSQRDADPPPRGASRPRGGCGGPTERRLVSYEGAMPSQRASSSSDSGSKKLGGSVKSATSPSGRTSDNPDPA